MAKTTTHINMWLVNGMILLVLLLSWWLQQPSPEIVNDVSLKGMPYLIDNKVGSDVPLPPFEKSLYEKGSWVNRMYKSTAVEGAREDVVWVLAVQTHEDRHAHHPPEYCYTGAGWQIITSREAVWSLDAFSSHPTIALAERKSAGSEAVDKDIVAYWFSNGERLVGSYFSRVLWDSWDRLHGKVRSWVMVRIVVPLHGVQRQGGSLDIQQGEAQLERASRLVYAALQSE